MKCVLLQRFLQQNNIHQHLATHWEISTIYRLKVMSEGIEWDHFFCFQNAKQTCMMKIKNPISTQRFYFVRDFIAVIIWPKRRKAIKQTPSRLLLPLLSDNYSYTMSFPPTPSNVGSGQRSLSKQSSWSSRAWAQQMKNVVFSSS